MTKADAVENGDAIVRLLPLQTELTSFLIAYHYDVEHVIDFEIEIPSVDPAIGVDLAWVWFASSAPRPQSVVTQPSKPAKKVAIAISVGIVTLVMFSALAFYLYKHRVKHPDVSQKLVSGNSSGGFEIPLFFIQRSEVELVWDANGWFGVW
ncbi:unnamed protein product [Fraxinus pennsylvanica]|uniref:Uncharacterized protein n=1 Tax=Fraxinus pennsylvanica TaxID=56036 RepID=A0AAD1ZCN6_9LAMI|nr:unnamed protein product [Fraxinus pennsylvanica]